MAIACPAPDPALGVVLRLSRYFDCEGRALGENGFQALVGGPAWAVLLSAVVTIFIALIGYRMMLGTLPSLRDGVGWAVRLGVVLTLVTGWTAFQTLVYRASVDGPGDLAATILPASGLAADDLAPRLQDAYDRLRLGHLGDRSPSSLASQSATTNNAPPGQGAAIEPSATPLGMATASTVTQGYGQLPLPQTAMLFAVATLGLGGGLHLASGLLIAIAPLAILGLLFDATLGVFSGWVRALVGVTLGALATTAASAIALTALDSQFAQLDAAHAAGASAAVSDPGGLSVTVAVSLAVTLLMLVAAVRTANAFRLPDIRQGRGRAPEKRISGSAQPLAPSVGQAISRASQTMAQAGPPSRAALVAQALDLTARRESGYTVAASTPVSRAAVVAEVGGRTRYIDAGGSPLGIAGRRGLGRRTRSATRRDRLQ